MATTLVNFTPTEDQPWTHRFTAVTKPPTLGGKPRTETMLLTTYFNLYSNRYYIKCTAATKKVIFFIPLIGSPDDYDFNLAQGYMLTKIVYREGAKRFEITNDA